MLVQLPIYNEAHVVQRLIDAVAALDYPRDLLSIQVIDDSTDHTSAMIQAHIEMYRSQGVDIVRLRRPDRSGYKAGALAYGVAHTGAELVAIFDADFLPAPDFLRRVVPYLLQDPVIGVVQARWGHLNPADNLLTRAQALSIDTHFIIEQQARSRAGLMLNFSGSGGIWRRACIEDAGGWRDTTLTEDLDLSYRAQLKGWRCLFVPEVVVPAELPPQLTAYKRQQARWAKGNTQCLRRHGGRLLRMPANPLKKALALAHLGQYLAHPLLLVLLVLAVPLMLNDVLQQLSLSVLGLLSLAPISAFALSQAALYRHKRWPLRLLALPGLILLGAGVTINNSLAVLSALLGRPGEFKRTPKFGTRHWQASRYALLADRSVWAELVLGLYAVLGLVLALHHDKPAAAPLFATYALACGGMVALAALEHRRVARAPESRS